MAVQLLPHRLWRTDYSFSAELPLYLSENQSSISVSIYLWNLFHPTELFVFVSMSILHCLDYYIFIISLPVRCCESSSCSL